MNKILLIILFLFSTNVFAISFTEQRYRNFKQHIVFATGLKMEALEERDRERVCKVDARTSGNVDHKSYYIAFDALLDNPAYESRLRADYGRLSGYSAESLIYIAKEGLPRELHEACANNASTSKIFKIAEQILEILNSEPISDTSD